jgi:O-antigen ligase
MPWKFGYGPPVAWLCVAVSCLIFRQRGLGPWAAAAFLMLIGIGYVLLGSRAQGAAVALTAAFLIFQQFAVARGRRGRPVRLFGFATLGLLGFLVGNGLLQLYGIAASEGMLGVYQQQKYKNQSRGDLGLFLSGRNEILASSQAIADSPVIGHGSWAKDRRYQIVLFQALTAAGQVPIFDPSDPKMVMMIPSHSHIAGTWVEAGIMGGIFWAWILILGLRSLMALTRTNRRYSPLFAYVLMTMLWAILFSPFGGPGRLLSPFYVCTTLVALGPISTPRYRP